MIRAILALLVSIPAANACSICGDSFTRRQTLRTQHADAKAVLLGQLRNPKANADGIGGTTEFHVVRTLKGQASPAMIVIPRYLPVIGATPPDYLFFCTIIDGKLETLQGTPASAAFVEYLTAAAKLDSKDPPAILKAAFAHLEAKDESVAADAFLEFAQAKDADIAKAAPGFDRAKLRGWIANANVPAERLGVYALLLGLSGGADDAAWLAGQLALNPRPERYGSQLGGLLAGLTLLDPARGWPIIQKQLADNDVPVFDKLSVVGCLRYFQSVWPKETHAEILKCCKTLLAQPDLADLAIEDLRRWAVWDLTDDVQKCYTATASPMLKRVIVRYALVCPNPEAKTFVNQLRSSNPKLVEKVESGLKAK